LVHYVRLNFVNEDVPELAQPMPKLTLKLAGRPLSDDDAGLVKWDVWMDKAVGG
jgi:hypothetical protein